MHRNKVQWGSESESSFSSDSSTSRGKKTFNNIPGGPSASSANYMSRTNYPMRIQPPTTTKQIGSDLYSTMGIKKKKDNDIYNIEIDTNHFHDNSKDKQKPVDDDSDIERQKKEEKPKNKKKNTNYLSCWENDWVDSPKEEIAKVQSKKNNYYEKDKDKDQEREEDKDKEREEDEIEVQFENSNDKIRTEKLNRNESNISNKENKWNNVRDPEKDRKEAPPETNQIKIDSNPNETSNAKIEDDEGEYEGDNAGWDNNVETKGSKIISEVDEVISTKDKQEIWRNNVDSPSKTNELDQDGDGEYGDFDKNVESLPSNRKTQEKPEEHVQWDDQKEINKTKQEQEQEPEQEQEQEQERRFSSIENEHHDKEESREHKSEISQSKVSSESEIHSNTIIKKKSENPPTHEHQVKPEISSSSSNIKKDLIQNWITKEVNKYDKSLNFNNISNTNLNSNNNFGNSSPGINEANYQFSKLPERRFVELNEVKSHSYEMNKLRISTSLKITYPGIGQWSQWISMKTWNMENALGEEQWKRELVESELEKIKEINKYLEDQVRKLQTLKYDNLNLQKSKNETEKMMEKMKTGFDDLKAEYDKKIELIESRINMREAKINDFKQTEIEKKSELEIWKVKYEWEDLKIELDRYKEQNKQLTADNNQWKQDFLTTLQTSKKLKSENSEWIHKVKYYETDIEKLKNDWNKYIAESKSGVEKTIPTSVDQNTSNKGDTWYINNWETQLVKSQSRVKELEKFILANANENDEYKMQMEMYKKENEGCKDKINKWNAQIWEYFWYRDDKNITSPEIIKLQEKVNRFELNHKESNNEFDLKLRNYESKINEIQGEANKTKQAAEKERDKLKEEIHNLKLSSSKASAEYQVKEAQYKDEIDKWNEKLLTYKKNYQIIKNKNEVANKEKEKILQLLNNQGITPDKMINWVNSYDVIQGMVNKIAELEKSNKEREERYKQICVTANSTKFNKEMEKIVKTYEGEKIELVKWLTQRNNEINLIKGQFKELITELDRLKEMKS